MFPEPLVAKPILELVFVQLYTVPLTSPVNEKGVVCELLQNVWSATELTVGMGLAVMLELCDAPVHVIPLFE